MDYYSISRQIKVLQTEIKDKQTKISKANEIKRDLGDSQTGIFRITKLWDDAKSNYNTVSKGVFVTDVFEGEAAEQLPPGMQVSVEKMTKNKEAMVNVRGNIGGQIDKLVDYIEKLTEEISELENQIQTLQASLKNM